MKYGPNRYSINIDTSNNSNSLSNIEFDVKLKFIAVAYYVNYFTVMLKKLSYKEVRCLMFSLSVSYP
jgi:hypothetical protein